jgi:hypothetical protein
MGSPPLSTGPIKLNVMVVAINMKNGRTFDINDIDQKYHFFGGTKRQRPIEKRKKINNEIDSFYVVSFWEEEEGKYNFASAFLFSI